MNKNTLPLFPLLLVFYEMAAYLTNDAYLPALPAIVSDLMTNDHLAQLTLTTWFTGMASVQLILGPISDRYGRRHVLLIGGIIFILSTLTCALAPNIGVLLFARFVQGATVASMLISGYAAINELFDHEKAIHVLAMMVSITVLGPAFGPLFGAIVLNFVGWRWIFGILTLCGAMIISILLFKMPETNPKGYENPIEFKRIVAQYKNMLCNLNFLRIVFSYCFLFGALTAWITAASFLIIDEFHHSTLEFGLLQSMVFGCLMVGTRFVKPLMQKYEIRCLIKIGLGGALLGGLLSASTLIFPKALTLFIISMMLISAGIGFSAPLIYRTAIEASSEPMGIRTAMYTTLVTSFGIVGSSLINTVYNGTLGSLAIILLIFSSISFLLMYKGGATIK